MLETKIMTQVLQERVGRRDGGREKGRQKNLKLCTSFEGGRFEGSVLIVRVSSICILNYQKHWNFFFTLRSTSVMVKLMYHSINSIKCICSWIEISPSVKKTVTGLVCNPERVEMYFWDCNYVDQLNGKIMLLWAKLTQKKLSGRWSATRRFEGMIRENCLDWHIVEVLIFVRPVLHSKTY